MRGLIYRILLSGLLAFQIMPGSSAKWEDPPSFRDRIFFGGNFGLSFGNTTYIDVSPLAGYRITPRLAGGLGIRYEYYKSNYPGNVFETHKYGGSVFGRYMIINNISEAVGLGGFNSGIFLQGEYELLSLESEYFDLSNSFPGERFYLHSVLIGGGIYHPIGRRSGFMITVLWNLNESYNSIYANPIIRFGFNF